MRNEELTQEVRRLNEEVAELMHVIGQQGRDLRAARIKMENAIEGREMYRKRLRQAEEMCSPQQRDD